MFLTHVVIQTYQACCVRAVRICRTQHPVHIVVLVARWLERLTRDKKIDGSIRVWGSENVSEFSIELECGHRQQSTDGLKNCVIYTIKMLLKMLFVWRTYLLVHAIVFIHSYLFRYPLKGIWNEIRLKEIPWIIWKSFWSYKDHRAKVANKVT